MTRRCDRNRKRSKRRAIHCPIHQCYLDSVSLKYPLFAEQAEQLQARGMSSKRSRLVISSYGTVPMPGEWLENFWCNECQQSQWYHVCKTDERTYELRSAPRELWQQVPNVIPPAGNPTVGEFTRRQARFTSLNGARDFGCRG